MFHSRVHQPRIRTFEKKVLIGCKYPRWAIKKILQKQVHSQDKTNRKKQHQSLQKKICHMVVPYSKGMSESFKNICKKYGIQVYFKGEKNTLKTYWYHLRKKTTSRRKVMLYTGSDVTRLTAGRSI